MKTDNDKKDEYRLFRIIDAVADGLDVDWNSAESSAPEDHRSLINKLRLISSVSFTHKIDSDADEVIDGDPGQPVTSFAGETWGHLQIIEKIGEGAFGVVYRANDPFLDREVALKLFHPDHVQPSRQTVQAIEEGRLLARVRHPNVAMVHGAEQYNGCVGIWMELIEGSTLQEIIQKRGALAPDESMKIAREVCRALTALHEAGIIHRDVKAKNIMQADDDRIVLMDLGVSRDIDRLDSVKVYGTPLFAAPEVLLENISTLQSDLYSVGVLLCVMLTGHYPASGTTLEEVRENHRDQRTRSVRDLKPNLPEDLNQIIDRALATDPADRFASAGELEAALDEALGEGPDSRETSTDGSTSIKVTKSFFRTPRFVLFLLAFILVGAAIFYTNLSREKDITLERQLVLVTYLENLTGDASLDPLGGIAADWINQGLSHAGFADVVPTMVARQYMRPQLAGMTALQDMSFFEAITEASGAAVIVSGTYHLESDTLAFQLNLTDTQRGMLKYVLPPVRGPLSSRMETIDELRSRTMSALSYYLAPAFEVDIFTQLDSLRAPPPYEATREYLAGVDHFGVDDRRSLYHFHRALELDSTLVTPQFWIAGIYVKLGSAHKANSIYRILDSKRDLLVPFERHMLDEFIASMDCDWKESLKYMKMAEIYAPRDFTVVYMVAVDELLAGNPQEAVDALAKVGPSEFYKDHVVTKFRYWILAQAYHVLGDYQMELETARLAFELYPDFMWIRCYEVRALAAMGQIEEIDTVIDECLKLPYDSGNPGEVMCCAAEELRSHDRFEAAHEFSTQAIEWFGEQSATLDNRADLAEAYRLNGQWAEARDLFAELAREDPDDVAYLGKLGALSVRLGDVDRSTEIFDVLEHSDSIYRCGYHIYWRACISALRNEPEQAVSLLKEAIEEHGLDHPIIRLSSEMDFETLREYPPFQELIKLGG